MRKVKKGICVILSVALLLTSLSNFSSSPLKAAEFDTGYITVNVMPSNSTAHYQALLKGDDIYVSIDDIAAITSYTVDVKTVGDYKLLENMKPKNKVKDDEKIFVLTRENAFANESRITIFRDVACMINGRLKIKSIMQGETLYCNITEMLYLLHAQWYVQDSVLVVYPCGKSILNFVEANMSNIMENSVNPTDLLMNSEGKWVHSFRTEMAATYKDFSFKYLNTTYGGMRELDKDQYKKSLLRLSYTDGAYLDVGLNRINELLGKTTFNDIKTNWDAIVNIHDLPLNSAKTYHGFKQIVENNPFAKFDSKTSISGLDLNKWDSVSKRLELAGTVVDALDITYNAMNVYYRSQKWGSEYLDQLSLLKNLNQAGYPIGGISLYPQPSSYVQNAASELLKEKENSFKAAFQEAIVGLLDFAAEESLDKTPIGPFRKSVLGVMAIVEEISPDIALSISNAADMYTTSCLMDVHNIAYSEVEHVYNTIRKFNTVQNMLQHIDNHIILGKAADTKISTSEDYQLSLIRDLRTALTLLLNATLSNQISVYKYNMDSSSTPQNWVNSDDAKRMINNIYQTYVWMIELENTEGYDRLITLNDDFSKIYSDENEVGKIRKEITKDVFHEGEIPSIGLENDIYKDFISRGHYLEYTEEWGFDADKYAIIDIEKDGIPELIIEGGYMWYSDLIFKYDNSSDKVVLIESLYHYNDLSYSERKKALVYTEVRPSGGYAVIEFSSIQGMKFINLFSVYRERIPDSADSFNNTIFENGLERSISDADLHAIRGNEIDFIDIGTVKTPTSSKHRSRPLKPT